MDTFKVGLMVLASLIAVTYMSLQVTSNQSGFGDYVTYRAVANDASGIYTKASIRIAGVSAGRVVDIRLVGNHALITFEILKEIVVPKDSRLRIKSVGLLGDKYLEILVGSSEEQLPEKSFIPVDEGGGLANLVNDLSEVLVDVKKVVAEVKQSIVPDDGSRPVSDIIVGVRKAVQDMQQAVQVVRDVAVNNREALEGIVTNLEDFAADLRYQVDAGNQDSAMTDVKNILANVEDMTADLKKVVFDIKNGKGTVGKFLREDKIADEVTETLAGVNKLVNRVNMIKTEVEMFSGSNTSFGAETHASLKVYPSPERFYLLGLVTSEFGVSKEKRIVTKVNGVETVTDEAVRDKDTYRFNFQMGRQFNNWTFRGGLIESTGGLGLDYQLQKWNQKFGLEVFDYREDIGANIRLASEIQLWNIVYGRVAIEEITNDSQSTTFSVGLRFADEDIKGLLGFFLR